ncbi:MAG: hypothetical protein ACLUP8_04515 [Ruminococcus sp.]|uniref:hypothetical protein n=1 Tax=Ruminococcus sp. TaxID=41978 RepID=UPI0039969C04
MAKFNIEVELDWVDEESEYTIDEEIKEQVVRGVKDALLRKATDEAVQRVDKAIADKILEAEETIQETVDRFVKTVSEEKIANIMIPIKTGSWSSDVKYIPLSEYVGERFEAFSTEKRYDKHGNTSTYSSDRALSMAELLTWQYLEKELGTKVEKMIANAKRDVEETLVKSLEQNPTPIDDTNVIGWELKVVKHCRMGLRKRSMTELLFCMLRSGR